MYEYKVVFGNLQTENQIVNVYASEGWRLVTVIQLGMHAQPKYYFERPKKVEQTYMDEAGWEE